VKADRQFGNDRVDVIAEPARFFQIFELGFIVAVARLPKRVASGIIVRILEG